MILVIGDAMVDRYIDGRIRRMAQEAPVAVFEPTGDYREYPGGAANVAANVAALGEKVVLVGDGLAPPIRKTRYVVGGNLILRVDEETENPRIDPTRVIDAAAKVMGGASAVVISDYGKGVISEEVAAYAVQAAREWGIPLIVDPKPPLAYPAFWRGASVIKLNEPEAAIIAGMANDPPKPHSPERTAFLVRGFCECDHVVMTAGIRGMFWASGQGTLHILAHECEVSDVVGAGDTVAAALAVGLSRGWGMERAARFANAAASIVVGKHGTATASEAEVDKVFEDFLGEFLE